MGVKGACWVGYWHVAGREGLNMGWVSGGGSGGWLDGWLVRWLA